MRSVIVVGSAPPTALRLVEAFARSGIATVPAGGVSEAAHLSDLRGADFVLFDPDLVGDDPCPRLRARRPEVLAIAWLSRASSARTAKLLARGADEVLHAGMSEEELIARVRATTRRATAGVGHVVDLGRLRVDAAHGEALWDGRELALTKREREVLQILAASAGRVVRREDLYRRVWGYAMPRGDRTVDVNIKRLRTKLAAAAGDAIAIRTQAGVGHLLEVAVAPLAVTGL